MFKGTEDQLILLPVSVHARTILGWPGIVSCVSLSYPAECPVFRAARTREQNRLRACPTQRFPATRYGINTREVKGKQEFGRRTVYGRVATFVRLFVILAVTVPGALYGLHVGDERLFLRLLVVGAFLTTAFNWERTAAQEGRTPLAKRLWIAVLALMALLMLTMFL